MNASLGNVIGVFISPVLAQQDEAKQRLRVLAWTIEEYLRGKLAELQRSITFHD